jgi:hypothetical protein
VVVALQGDPHVNNLSVLKMPVKRGICCLRSKSLFFFVPSRRENARMLSGDFPGNDIKNYLHY